MLGFFDSGFGGLTVLREVNKLLPRYSTLYLGDNARAPYGDRDQETIYQFTTEGINEFFRRGCELVILACNTSSSVALRRIQQEWLPIHFPEKRVLGIIIPTAEGIGAFTETREVGVLGTKATTHSLVYTQEIAKVYPDIKVYEVACPMFVPLIEEGESNSLEFPDLIQIYLNELLVQSFNIDTVILGCTHYALIEDQIKRQLPYGVRAISQGPIIARKLKDYLSRHPELEKSLEKDSERIFLSTDASPRVESLSSLFYGSPVKIELVKLRGGV